jgi:hypothetical protein
MLIIAMPKSAITTLVATLGEAHGLPVESQRIRDEVVLRRKTAPRARSLEASEVASQRADASTPATSS